MPRVYREPESRNNPSRYKGKDREEVMKRTESMLWFVNNIWNIAYYGRDNDTLKQAVDMMDEWYSGYTAYLRTVAKKIPNFP